MAIASAFKFNRTITIDTTSGGATISGSLTDFPVCVAVNASSWSNATSRGRFFDASNTAGKRVQFYSGTTSLAYEVESYDDSGQTAIYWVKVGTINGNSTTVIKVAYGNDPNGSAQDAATSVWDGTYLAVHHLVDATTSTTADSTANALTGTKTGANNPQSGAEYVGTGQSFNGTTGRIQISPSAVPAAISYSLWVNAASWTPAYTCLMAVFEGTANEVAFLGVKSTGKLACYFANKNYDGAGSNTLSTGTWYHVAATYSSAVGLVGYVNGASDGTATAGVGIVNGSVKTFGFGGHPSIAGRYLAGHEDEVRISTAVRSADWIRGEYFSMKATSWNGDGWMTLGAEVGSLARSQAVVV